MMHLDNIHALLFDMDGVVIDTHASVEFFWNQLARTHQVTLTNEDFERFIHGTQSRRTLKQYFPMLNAGEMQKIEQDIAIYEDNLTYQLVAGVLDFLNLLKQHHIPTALVTSGKQRKVDSVFAQFDLADKFDAIVTADVISRGKPHPDCYELGAKKLSVSPQNCIVFEDSLSGTHAGLSARAQVIGVGKTSILLDIGAVTVIPNFVDFSVKHSDPKQITLLLPGSGELTLIRRFDT
ncbi:MAG: HAD-IA family hydrolase [Anaerolineaceae bacterium]|nr:HAD-IA family hydrolase [Anaerolineaceae bacterium]